MGTKKITHTKKPYTKNPKPNFFSSFAGHHEHPCRRRRKRRRRRRLRGTQLPCLCLFVCFLLFVGHRKTISGESERKEEDRRIPCFASSPAAAHGTTRRQWWWRVGGRATTPPATSTNILTLFLSPLCNFLYVYVFYLSFYCIFNYYLWNVMRKNEKDNVCVSCILIIKRWWKRDCVGVCVVFYLFNFYVVLIKKRI